jgi:alpha-galactosidase
MAKRRAIKVAFIGGGSMGWAPKLVRDIIFKEGMEQIELEFALLDTNLTRAKAIKRIIDLHLGKWRLKRVRVYATSDSQRAIKGAHFVLITISTGGLEAMRPDLEIPEQYGIFHTVGDTAGPGGWSRALRNIPVFARYADETKVLAPDAYVLNYTNPMGTLTKVLSDRLKPGRVIGLCHGLFEFHIVMRQIFGLESEKDVEVRFGGLNHFFWILDFTIGGREGYALLRKKMGRRPLYELMDAIPREIGGWTPGNRLASELFDNYGYLPYTADRHICEFFTCYTTNKELMERFGLDRTTIADRESYYARANCRMFACISCRRLHARCCHCFG